MILTVNNLQVRSKTKELVKDVDFSVRPGEWFALVGQSGSGKTLLSQAIGQMLGPNLKADGEIIYQDRNLLDLSGKEMKKLRGKNISYIFQDYQGSFTPFMTIKQHFKEYQKAHGIKSSKEREEQALTALESVGLEAEIYKRYPFQLSGGQLQRVSIALALLLKPDILISDEATTALDSVSSRLILELLSNLQRETNCAVLFITHDWRHVKRYADHIAVMKEGEIVEKGGRHRVLDHPRHPYTKQLISSAPTLSQTKLLGVTNDAVRS